jgi:hypothetical protein
MNPGTDWIEQGRRLLETFRSSTEAPDGEHAADCRWCPVCQAAAVVRGERPEVTAALADVLTTAAAALRTFAEAGAESGAGSEGGSTPPVDVEDDDEDGAQPAVQQIDIA